MVNQIDHTDLSAQLALTSHENLMLDRRLKSPSESQTRINDLKTKQANMNLQKLIQKNLNRPIMTKLNQRLPHLNSV